MIYKKRKNKKGTGRDIPIDCSNQQTVLSDCGYLTVKTETETEAKDEFTLLFSVLYIFIQTE